MRTGAILGNAGLDHAVVLAMTGLTDLDSVDVRPAPAWMRRLWVGDVAAMTLMSRVYCDPGRLAEGGPALGRLLVHELVHVRQWRQQGPLRFVVRYVTDYVRGRVRGLGHAASYRSIRYEVEARVIAGA